MIAIILAGRAELVKEKLWQTHHLGWRHCESMLHEFFYFPQVPVYDGYNMGMGVRYVSDTHTHCRHLAHLNFLIFERKKKKEESHNS